LQAAPSQNELALTAWIAERPDLAGKIFTYIEPDDIHNPVCRMIIEKAMSEQDKFEPAAFINDAGLTTEGRRLAAEVFAWPDRNGSILGKDKSGIEKGLTEYIRTVKADKIELEMSKCGSDLRLFGELLREKNALRNFRVTL
ncbi:MAG: hypothetical protein Q4E57_08885, partial [Eubacteriales bacterium]|nr:hypothetical protein [Eubacteriales bacterium]